SMFLLPLHEARHLRKTWRAPRRPEVEEDDLPAEARQGDFPVVEILPGKVGRGAWRSRSRLRVGRDGIRQPEGDHDPRSEKDHELPIRAAAREGSHRSDHRPTYRPFSTGYPFFTQSVPKFLSM